MKKLTTLLLVALSVLAISSCDKHSCAKVVCASYQMCYNGDCLCPNGYEGDTCSVLSSTKFIGNWQVTENCSPDQSSFPYYSTNILPTNTGNPNYAVNVIYFNYLLGSGPVYAQILNTTSTYEGLTLYIPPQSLGNGVVISGSQGYYSPPVINGAEPTMTITMNYSYQGNSYTCTESFHKQ
jgi:hypothetical protein